MIGNTNAFNWKKKSINGKWNKKTKTKKMNMK